VLLCGLGNLYHMRAGTIDVFEPLALLLGCILRRCIDSLDDVVPGIQNGNGPLGECRSLEGHDMFPFE
jgi:hypothetical protein